jgi:flavin-dependent dehydrogenase
MRGLDEIVAANNARYQEWKQQNGYEVTVLEHGVRVKSPSHSVAEVVDAESLNAFLDAWTDAPSVADEVTTLVNEQHDAEVRKFLGLPPRSKAA